eukprot:1140557-Pelagomonas_calceolata.AAC.6
MEVGHIEGIQAQETRDKKLCDVCKAFNGLEAKGRTTAAGHTLKGRMESQEPNKLPKLRREIIKLICISVARGTGRIVTFVATSGCKAKGRTMAAGHI